MSKRKAEPKAEICETQVLAQMQKASRQLRSQTQQRLGGKGASPSTHSSFRQHISNSTSTAVVASSDGIGAAAAIAAAVAFAVNTAFEKADAERSRRYQQESSFSLPTPIVTSPPFAPLPLPSPSPGSRTSAMGNIASAIDEDSPHSSGPLINASSSETVPSSGLSPGDGTIAGEPVMVDAFRQPPAHYTVHAGGHLGGQQHSDFSLGTEEVQEGALHTARGASRGPLQQPPNLLQGTVASSGGLLPPPTDSVRTSTVRTGGIPDGVLHSHCGVRDPTRGPTLQPQDVPLEAEGDQGNPFLQTATFALGVGGQEAGGGTRRSACRAPRGRRGLRSQERPHGGSLQTQPTTIPPPFEFPSVPLACSPGATTASTSVPGTEGTPAAAGPPAVAFPLGRLAGGPQESAQQSTNQRSAAGSPGTSGVPFHLGCLAEGLHVVAEQQTNQNSSAGTPAVALGCLTEGLQGSIQRSAALNSRRLDRPHRSPFQCSCHREGRVGREASRRALFPALSSHPSLGAAANRGSLDPAQGSHVSQSQEEASAATGSAGRVSSRTFLGSHAAQGAAATRGSLLPSVSSHVTPTAASATATAPRSAPFAAPRGAHVSSGGDVAGAPRYILAPADESSAAARRPGSAMISPTLSVPSTVSTSPAVPSATSTSSPATDVSTLPALPTGARAQRSRGMCRSNTFPATPTWNRDSSNPPAREPLSVEGTPEVHQRGVAEEKLCIVCFEKERAAVFVPCGHLVCCYECACQVRERSTRGLSSLTARTSFCCPMCRKVCSMVVKVYQ